MTTVTFSMTPDYVVEKPATQITFNFDLDEAPPPGQYVSVWFYGSDRPNAPVSEARHGAHTLADFDLMAFGLDPDAQQGVNIWSYQHDVSVEAGVSNTGTFHVIELRLTQQHNSLTFTGFDDKGSVDDAPRSYYWNVIDDPNEGTDVTVVNGSLKFTEYTTPDQVPAANTAPDATDDTASTDFGAPVTIDVLANDSDGDNDALVVTAAGGASNGSVAIVNGKVVYTPNAGFSGDDSFTYTVSDGKGGTDTATVSVSVEPGETPVEPVRIEGTAGTDRLAGTAADEIIAGKGGAIDILQGGGGADVFEFRNMANGKAEAAYITDFGADDRLDLGGAAITQQFVAGGSTHLILEGDGDRIVLLGFDQFDADINVLTVGV